MIALVLMAALGPPPGPVADDPASPAALFGLYRRNVDGLRTLKVQWRREQRATEAWLLDKRQALEALATEIARLDGGSGDSHAKRQEMMALRRVITVGYAPKTMFQTFLTDRTRFMTRTAPAHWGAIHPDDDWLMPDVPVTPESMAAKYAGFALVSFSGDRAAGFRTWTPQPFGSGGGMIQATEPAPTEFPPLGVALNNWGGQGHPIDAFFRNDPATCRTVGRATIDGHETVIVENRAENPDARSFLSEVDAKALGAGVRKFDVVRAYLDPERGGLPLKIEWDGEFLVDGKPTPRSESSRPYRVLEVTEILELKGGGFYPSRGVDRTYGPDPKWTGPRNTIAGLLAGKALEVPVVPFEETTWQAAKVEANEALDETFALKFPDGAYYYNAVTNTSQRAGWEDRDASRLPWALCGLIAAGWAVYGLAVLTGTKLGRGRRPRRPASA